jgi:hypothetical protein
MKAPLFEYPSYQYHLTDWYFKKKAILGKLKKEEFIRTPLQTFECDRQKNKNRYLHFFQDLIRAELNQFYQEENVTCTMTDCWSVRYKKGDQQFVHNHRSWGFSGVLYVEYDSKLHTPTCFVSPWQNPTTDTTILSYPQNVREGTLVIFPSYTLHFVPPNQCSKQRTIISFDLLPKLPDHRAV